MVLTYPDVFRSVILRNYKELTHLSRRSSKGPAGMAYQERVAFLGSQGVIIFANYV